MLKDQVTQKEITLIYLLILIQYQMHVFFHSQTTNTHPHFYVSIYVSGIGNHFTEFDKDSQ